MKSERQVPEEKGKIVAKKLKMTFLEISAKYNINVDKAFETLKEQVMKV